MIRLAVTAALVLLGTASVPACSSSGSSGTTNPPSSDFCSQASDYVTRCHVTDACTLAFVQECSTIAGNDSAATLAAQADCIHAATCSDAGAAGSGLAGCLLQKPASPPAPTAAQTKLAQDYCAVCPRAGQTAAECVAGFYGNVNDAGATGVGGPGNAIFGLSDSVASSVDTQCIPKLGGDAGTFGCALTFDACLFPIVVAAVKPPAACTTIPGLDAGTPAADGG
jgi:hypothetical protein